MKPFKYVNKGGMATVGRNKAVVDLAQPKLSFQGFFCMAHLDDLASFFAYRFQKQADSFH